MFPLPSPEKEVTTDPTIKVIKERNPGKYVRAILQLDVFDRRYIKSELGTFCNRYVHDVCQVTGVPLPRRHDGWAMLANDMIDYWNGAPNGWQKMVWQDAVSNTMMGCPTFHCLKAKGHGHVGVVLPAATTSVMGVITAQAGKSNFYGRPITYAYSLGDLPKVEFFGHP